jgi:hypothetical protein
MRIATLSRCERQNAEKPRGSGGTSPKYYLDRTVDARSGLSNRQCDKPGATLRGGDPRRLSAVARALRLGGGLPCASSHGGRHPRRLGALTPARRSEFSDTVARAAVRHGKLERHYARRLLPYAAVSPAILSAARFLTDIRSLWSASRSSPSAAFSISAGTRSSASRSAPSG